MAINVINDAKCFWHLDFNGTCTANFPISDYHCPDCDYCMLCGGFDLPITFPEKEGGDISFDPLIERIKRENQTLAYRYGKPNGS